MPISKLSFRPGITKESTTYANEGTYYDGNWVRFRSNYAEKIGGWQNLSFANTFYGITRSLQAWVTYANQRLLGFGTSQKYYVEYGSKYFDITPVRAGPTTLGATPLATTDGSYLVTVTHSANGVTAGTYVRITSTAVVGGLDIEGEYEVLTATTNTFTVSAGAAATATTTGGGTVTVTCDLNAGSSTYSEPSNAGWGAGPYGNSGWGQSVGELAPTVQTTNLRLWSQCVYGEDLIMAPRGGTLYYWNVDVPTYARAVTVASLANALGKVVVYSGGITFAGAASSITVTDPTGITAGSLITGTNITAGTYVTAAYDGGTSVPISAVTTGTQSGNYTFSYAGRFVPNQTEYVFSADVSKFIVCLGANPYDPFNFTTAYDPMLVRWSDQDNTYEWTPSFTNQTGEQRLSIGSYLVCAQNTRQEILIWSNAALYSMQYLGPPYVFGFNLLSDNISIASPNAVVTVNNMTFWMGVDKFYAYTGRVEPLPCTLWGDVFNDLNREQILQVVSGTNEGYNEVWWFYPSADSAINDRYVIYNYVDNLWYSGELTRTAWLDSPLRDNPMGAFSTERTYLSAYVYDTDTEIPVLNAATLPASGSVVVDDEEISYASRTSDKLFGCIRGVSNTTAADHYQYSSVAYKIANQIMYHEVGTDDLSSSDRTAIYSFIASADFDIGDGHDFGFVSRILPDLTFKGSTVDNPQVTLKLKARSNSGTEYISSSSPGVRRSAAEPVETYTGIPVSALNAGQVYTRVRGRQMQFMLESTELGVAWQWGQMRIDIRPDGRRA